MLSIVNLSIILVIMYGNMLTTHYAKVLNVMLLVALILVYMFNFIPQTHLIKMTIGQFFVLEFFFLF